MGSGWGVIRLGVRIMTYWQWLRIMDAARLEFSGERFEEFGDVNCHWMLFLMSNESFPWNEHYG